MRDLTILFQDERVVAVDKPPGLLVHRSRESTDRVFLLQMLRDQIGQRLYPVHRLDRPASGVIAFGLDSDSARELQAAMAAPDAIKEYRTVCRGETPDRFVCDRPLTSDKGVKQEARTEFERVDAHGGFTMLRARLRTGRRHQIRRHLSHLGHQVVGDTAHGKGRINRWLREDLGLQRLFLHAERLECELVRAQAPLPSDLVDFWDRFRARQSD